MDHKQEFLKILKQENESAGIQFFKAMDQKDREAFIPVLKDICKEYLEFRSVLKGASYTVTRLATDKQASLLNVAAFVCFSEKDFRKWSNLWLLRSDVMNSLLGWYCPKWFNKYINSFGEEDFVPMYIGYDWIMELAEKGFSVPSKELIVKILPQALFEKTRDHKTLVKRENLLRRPITLDSHVWYFFEMESNIHMSDRYFSFPAKSKEKESEWMICLRDFCAQGKLDRHRLLEECILATMRNFNKSLLGWYCDLFSALGPSTGELLTIQRALLNALNCRHSKPVNTALNALKRITDSKGFDVDGFLEAIPLLLSSETRTIVHSTLVILDKIAKKHSDQKEAVCVASCQAFVHADDDIQSRAAKLIVKYGDPKSQVLNETLRAYRDSLLMNAISAMSAFLNDLEMDNLTPAIPATSEIAIETDSQRVEIPAIQSFDELIFLCSQAFDNNRSYQIDILPAALIALQKELRGDNIAKLEPALQRAFKFLTSGLTSTTGALDHLLATFFVDFTTWLISQYPLESTPLQALHISFDREEEKFREQMGRYYHKRLVPLKDWIVSDNSMYELHKRLLLVTLERLRRGDARPLLSTPTHEPSFISPAALIERLQVSQESGMPVDEIDLQVAISRCDLSNSEEHLAAVKQSLKGECRKLLEFLLTPTSRPQGPFTLSAAWVVASVARDKRVAGELGSFVNPEFINYLTGQFEWESLAQGGIVDRYNFAKQRFDKVKSNDKTLTIQFAAEKPKTFGLKSLFSNFKVGSNAWTSTIYDLLKFKRQPFGMGEGNDMARILYLTPNNPEPMLAQVISKALTYNRFHEANDQRIVASTIEALMPIETRYGQMGHLFIGTCMLSVDKTIQSFAAELWSRGVVRRHVDSRMLGEIIGKHESIEFAPMRRFTDLLSANMVNVSSLHNRALEILINEVVLRLPKQPVTGLKKLLEIYFQVLSANRSSGDANVIKHIRMWSDSPSLRKVVKNAEEKAFLNAV